MIIKIIGGLLLAASFTEAAVTTHEFIKTSNSPALLRVADRLMPLDAANDLRPVAVTAGDEPAISEQRFTAALAKNPWDTNSWIGLSALAENRGDSASAEKDLRLAAAHDIGREPRWAMANFYFRQGNQDRFLEAVNRYRSVTHDHEDGLFRMVAETVPDADALSAAMPNLGCDEMGTAVDVLRARQQPADTLVDRMASGCKDGASSKSLMALVNDLLLQDQVTRAAQIWQTMGQKSTLTNGDFSQPVAGQGFDWRLNQSPEVQFRQLSKGMEFNLEDGTADGTVLLFQPVILAPGATYRLSMNAAAEDSELKAFHWELVELSTGKHLVSGLDDEDINQQPKWEFAAPAANPRTLALALYYRRPAGSTPFTGKMLLSSVQLAPRLNN